MLEKSILIIGAGVAGLSTGVYGQMNGYKTAIFELGSTPGGLCTTWKRKGYSFDGCIHWLMGSKEGASFHQVWKELGAIQDRQFVQYEYFVEVIAPSGRKMYLYTNIDRLEEHFLEIAPEDEDLIRELIKDMRKLSNLKMPTDKPDNILLAAKTMFQMMPIMGIFKKWASINTTMLASRIKNPDLKYLFASVFNLPDMPAVAILLTLASMHNGDSGYPIGGSLPFSQAIEQRYLDLGGEIHYNTRVQKILVEDGKAVGIRLENGQEYLADIVVSAADGHATIFDMLEGKYINDEIAGYYMNMPIFQGVVQVSLGINRDLSNAPHSTIHSLPAPVSIGGQEQNSISTRIFNFDPTMAPAGKTVSITMFNSDYKFWKEIAGDRERYEAEKHNAAIAVIDQLEKIYPGITRQIEVVDVSTPLTTERYTGNWQGSIEGWQITRENFKTMMAGKTMKTTLPGLKNFYMTGQWVEPGGGLPPAGLGGRKLISSLCKLDKKPFKTTAA